MPLISNVSTAIFLAAIALAVAGASLVAVGIMVAVPVALEIILAVGAAERITSAASGSE